MKNPNDFDINRVYSYSSSKDLRNYYDDWAHEYEGYTQEVKYILPKIVAETAAELLDNQLRVGVDVGAGTGLVGEYLSALKPNCLIHAADISQSMLAIARSKKTTFLTHCYNRSILMDFKNSDKLEFNYYDFLVSAGTFTLGHLNFEDLDNITQCLKADAFGVISVKKDHYEYEDFSKKLKSNKKIKVINQKLVNSYDSDFTAESYLISFLKNPI